MKPIVAIVGKPNVGKSTIFNCLVGSQIAIVSEIAGTTRDRIYSKAELPNLDIILVDTGGLQYGKQENIEADVQLQALLAIKEADLIIFVVDGSAPLGISDDEVVKELRKKHKDIVFVANKTDRSISKNILPELFKCGLGAPIEVSAVHSRNMSEIVSEVEKKLLVKGFKKEKEERPTDMRIAILGRPNVGKSSLVNALIGEKKLIVSSISGTTRDAIDTEIMYKNKKVTLIDTAGLRRRGKIGKQIEYWSVLRGLRALERSDIAVIVLDATEGVVSQDEHIAGYIMEEKKGLIIALNKIDLIPNEDERNKLIRKIQRKLTFLPWAPVVFVSAETTENINILMKLALDIFEERKKEIPTRELKELMNEILLYHAPKSTNSKQAKIFSVEQTWTSPPTFTIIVNDPEAFHFSYRRYVERKIREEYGFKGTAISLKFQKKGRNN